MITNTPHPPQQILVRVKCTDRLPKEAEYYDTNIGKVYYSVKSVSFINEFGHKLNPEYWYEPATAIVLSVEDWNTIQNKINLLAADNGRLMNKLSQLTNHHP